VNGQGANSPTFTVTALPSGWSDQDVGSVGVAGSVSYGNNSFTVKASGADIWGTTDAMHFVYQSISGNATLIARVVSLQSGGGYHKAGVMIRETLNANAINAFSLFQGNIVFHYRPTTGGNTSEQAYATESLPYWVKIVRSGNSFSSYTSADGVNWLQVGSTQTISMATNAYVGLAVTSNNNSVLATATFDNVSLTSSSSTPPASTSVSPSEPRVGDLATIAGTGFGSSQGSSTVFLNGVPMPINSWSDTSIVVVVPAGAVPSPLVVSLGPAMNDSNILNLQVTTMPVGWLDQDIGSVGVPGSTVYANNSFTVQGAGAPFSGRTADAFHFAYQSLSGDGSIVARVASTNNGFAIAGVMIRETLTPGAADVAVAVYNGALSLYYRTATGGTSGGTGAGNVSLPYWVKLVRTGSSFTGYTSDDGENWVQAGAVQTISMAQNVYIGLAVTSGTTAYTYSATFDNVSLNTAASPAPEITSISATTGSSGTQVVISGQNFGSTQGNSVVLLNDAPMTVNSWSSTSITITVSAGATTGPLVISVAPGMNDSNPVKFTVTAHPLPSGWLDEDVGTLPLPGSATYSQGAFTLQSSGSGVNQVTADSFHFAYLPLAGDGTIVARVVSTSSGWAVAGVMIRDTLDAGSQSILAALYNQGSDIYYRTIPSQTSASASTYGVGGVPPYWVKLQRQGSTFAGYASPDGVTWTLISGPVGIAMAQNVYVALAVAGGGSSLYSATFDNVSLSAPSAPGPVITSLSNTTGPLGSQVTIYGSGFGASQGSSAVFLSDAPVTVNSWSSSSINITIPGGATSGLIVVAVGATRNSSNPVAFTVTSNPLPAGWLDTDIGAVGMPGNASYSNGVFTVQGAGHPIGNTVDSYHFVYQPLSTDGTIVARVVSSTNGYQAAVVMRETLDAGAPEAAAVMNICSGCGSVQFSYRPFLDALVTAAGNQGASLPIWLKVARSANTFSAYWSSNGVAWNQMGTTQTITTAQTIYVGLAVNSSNGSSLCTDTFDNVSVSLGGSLPNPVITGVSPAAGAPGATVTISGSSFGATQGTSTLSFNGAIATISSWSDDQIVAQAPDTATTGPVTATIGGISAQGPTFTVAFTAQLTDSLGNQTTYVSSLVGGQWSYTNAQGSGCSSCTTRGNIQNVYDANGNLLWTTDANGYTTLFQYDSSNNQTVRSVPIGTTTRATSTYTYNGLGEVLTATDPLGKVTSYAYDSKGNLTSITTPTPGGGGGAGVTYFTYNSLGEMTQIKDPLGNVTNLAYTSAGLVASITDAQNHVTTYGYDAYGNRTSVQDALNNTTTFAYDAMNRLTTITYPDTTTTTFAYDARGRRTSVTDQNGKTTTYAYDDADRLITVTDAAQHSTNYGYDTESNLTSINDANNNETMFTYDAFGRVTETSFPSTSVEQYAYDANNNLTSKTDRKGQTITYTYDQSNRLTQKSYPDSTSVNYTYDLDSRLTQVTDPTGTYTFTFDNMGRLTAATSSYSFLTGHNFTSSYTYDAASNRTGYTAPDGSTNTYAYDTLNRMSSLANSWAGTFGFSYDALSRRTQMTRPNSITTNYSYDTLSRLLSVLHQAGGSTIDGATYTVDAAGNRTSKADALAGVTSNYTYDALYELTQVTQSGNTTESYSYDPMGNRVSSLGVSPYAYNASNELTSTPSTSYAYDANGNTTSKTDSTGTTTYTWDYENRLTSVTLPGGGGTVSFKYDPFGRRIYKSSFSGTSIFAYDGDNLVEEANSSGTEVASYSQELNIDEPLAMLRSATTSFYEADGLGSVTSLSSGAGSLAQTYTFDSFGKLANSTGSLTSPFQYTARESDPETGLQFYRDRYYDSSSGRFLGEDRIGFSGGVNFYAYVYNDPTDFADPLGLQRYHKYKCNGFGQCYRAPSRRSTPRPSSEPCPLVTKAFNDFQHCAQETFKEKLPGQYFKELGKAIWDVKVSRPDSPGPPPLSPPGYPVGEYFGAVAGAYGDAVRDCFKKFPLAGLDPRFPVQDVGRLSAPTWWESLEDFFDFSPIPY